MRQPAVPTIDSEWVSLWTAARRTGLRPGELLELADYGWIPAYRFGGRTVRFAAEHLAPLEPDDGATGDS